MNRKIPFYLLFLALVAIVPSIAVSQLGPAPVDLGTAGDFVILANTGISTTGTTAITGDIGVSGTASLITGFTLSMDASNTFSTSSFVTGKVYAFDYTVPTPAKMDTAEAHMGAAYTDAAGRLLPDSTEMGAGDITSRTIPPGLYKWSTGLLISAAGVTLSGSASDVWIFQIAGDLTVADAAIVTLIGGAKARNVFWQVGGGVTIGLGAAMKGNILSQTLIAMNDGATLDGRALAQTAVTLIGNTVTKPSSGFAVTFQVNMSIKMREGSFVPGSGDAVRVAGSLNDWSTSADTLKDGDADSIYTITKSLAAGNIEYKFYKTLRAGLDWEGVSNRPATIAGDTTLPVVYFDNDDVFNPPVNQDVTFAVNMRIKLLEGSFRPDLGDRVRIAGTLNGWSTTADTLTDGNTDSIYTKTFTLLENANVNYKFYKTVRGGSDWEGDPNRVFTVPVGGGNPDTVYFDRDEVVDALVSGQVLWRVDMTTFENLGWFRRLSGDSVEVRGNFNGWSGTKLERVPSTEVYELLLPFDLSPANSDFSYKFFMDLDTNGIAARFPGYVDDPDGFRYDHPTERGDGNRQFNIGSGGNLEPPIVYFSSINPGGVILAGDTVTATFQVDMRPAMAYINPFVPSTDTAFIVWNDDPSRSKQGNPPNVRLSDANSDSIYTGNLTIAGPAHYNLLYFVRFEQPGGTSEEEGAGLGAQFGYRSRYITPTSPNTFTRNFTLPIDVWKADPPYPAETPPLVTAIEKAPLGPPDQFTLAQNYPNPFNPSTNIRYNLPSQARVILKIFNLLGQEVATLVNGTQVAGEHMVVFEAGRLAAGIYFYSLHAGEFREVRKMLLLK